MGNKSLDNAYNKGASDYKSGSGNHPPSSDGLKATIDTMTSNTTVDQRDSAYAAGRSDAGRGDKK